MSSEEIKQERERLEQQITDAQTRLRALRSQCQHINKARGLWSYRVGQASPAEFCADCGEFIQLLEN